MKKMAKIIENIDGKRKLIKLSSDDVISIVREYQNITRGCMSCREIRSALSDAVIYVPEEM